MNMFKVCIVLTSLLLVLVSWAPRCVIAAAIGTEQQTMMYLSEFGYFGHLKNNQYSNYMISEETKTKPIKDFKTFAAAKNPTGHLDEDTLHYTTLPRCGFQDEVEHESRSKRYAKSRKKWEVNDLTYTIVKYPKLLNKSITDSEIQKAFEVWADVTPLTFTHSNLGQVNINITFEEGKHGDKYPFDGPGGDLAHANHPPHGEVHFDGSEEWTVDSYKGINLFQVAVHEFGHLLGLKHSEFMSSVMTPLYTSYNPSFKLDKDDVEGIKAMYYGKFSSKKKRQPQKYSKKDNNAL